jgi:NAD(P)H-nitrite reductase large subunit
MPRSRHIIIGSGAAGIGAAEAIRSEDPSADIVLISEEGEGYYSRPGLAYYLSGEINERMLFPFSREDFDRLNITSVHGGVKTINPEEASIALTDGRHVTYDKLLIATGAAANKIKIPGADLLGVVKLDNIKDARVIIKQARKAKSAVVIGGGITALELVEGFSARRTKTHYFLRKNRYWGNVLDETESRIVEDRLKEDGVNLHYHTEPAEILGTKGRVTGVRTMDRETIKCQLVAIAIGIRPRTKLAVEAGLEIDRGILVNEYMQTDVPEIYAAGDVAQVYDPLTGKAVVDSLWGPARQQGYTAGKNMTGRQLIYRKDIPFNVTRLAGITTTIIGTVGQGKDTDLTGIARGDSETWRQIPDAIAAQSNSNVNRLRLLVGDRTLLGAIVMGDQTLSLPLQKMIVKHADISAIRHELLEGGSLLPEVLTTFWTNWRLEHASQKP